MTVLRRSPRPFGVALLVLSTLVFGATSVAARGHQAARVRALVKTTTANVLVTPGGRTLYVFAIDGKNTSKCYGTCAKYWPPLLVKKGHTPAAKVAGVPGTFGVATRKNGTHQLTYDGAPLYTYAGDTKAGDMNGQGLLVGGGYWWVVVAAGA